MAAAAHVIGRQVLELTLPRGVDAYRLQQELTELFRGTVVPALEALLDRQVPADRVLRLDRLKIDLGRLPQDRLAEAFPARVCAAVEAELARLLDRGDAIDAGREADHAGSVEHLSRDERALTLWHQVLVAGHLPWWATPADAERLEDDVIAALAGDRRLPDETARLLRAHPRARRRLVLQGGPMLLERVFGLADAELTTAARPLLAELEPLLARQSVAGLSAAATRAALEPALLAEALADGAAPHDTRLRHLLHAGLATAAEAAGLGLPALVEQMRCALRTPSDNGATVDSTATAALLDALADEIGALRAAPAFEPQAPVAARDSEGSRQAVDPGAPTTERDGAIPRSSSITDNGDRPVGQAGPRSSSIADSGVRPVGQASPRSSLSADNGVRPVGQASPRSSLSADNGDRSVGQAGAAPAPVSAHPADHADHADQREPARSARHRGEHTSDTTDNPAPLAARTSDEYRADAAPTGAVPATSSPTPADAVARREPHPTGVPLTAAGPAGDLQGGPNPPSNATPAANAIEPSPGSARQGRHRPPGAEQPTSHPSSIVEPTQAADPARRQHVDRAQQPQPTSIDARPAEASGSQRRAARPVPGTAIPAGESIHCDDAGIVLLHPFIAVHFERLGLQRDGAFIDDAARERAVHQLRLLGRGRENDPEPLLLLPKLLCGLPPEEPIAPSPPLSANAKTEADKLLAAVVRHWGALGNSSPDGLREAFLRRGGILQRKADGWRLRVGPNSAFDLLLGRLPWGLNVVRLPWMPEPLFVDWV